MPATQKPISHAFYVVPSVCMLLLAALAVVGCDTGAAVPAISTQAPIFTPIPPVVAPTNTAAPAADPTPLPTDTPPIADTPTEESVATQAPLADQWQQVGLAGKVAQDLAVSPNAAGIALATGPTGAWRGASEPTQAGNTTTAGNDYTKWDPLPVKVSGRITSGAIASADVMYITSHTGCLSGLPATLQRTTDGGKTWQEAPGQSEPLAVVAVDGKTAYAITCGGVVRTTDSGVSWAKLPGASLTNYDPHAIAASADGKTLYAAYASEGGTSRIMSSADSGNTWTEITPKTEPGTLLSAAANLTFVEGQQGEGGGFYMTSDQGLWYLPAGSRDWKLLRKNNPNVENPERITALYVKPGQAPAIYIATAVQEGGNLRGAGVLRSTDSAATWEQFGKGLDQSVVNSLVFAPYTHSSPPDVPGVLLAATNDGVWAITASLR